jgi:hypothetical protein
MSEARRQITVDMRTRNAKDRAVELAYRVRKACKRVPEEHWITLVDRLVARMTPERQEVLGPVLLRMVMRLPAEKAQDASLLRE